MGLGDAVDGGDSQPVDSFLRTVAHASDVGLLLPGARLAHGRFEIVRRLGAGGMGVVYAAHDHHRSCPVALKTMPATPEALRRLRGEFLALHDLVHPNLVKLDELIDDRGLAYFTMELVDGVDFFTYVRPDGVLDRTRLRAATRQLVEALAFLHAAGIVHRDVKPSNVLVAVGRVVLLDFGLAITADHQGVDTGGTVAYMAPEQAESPRVTPAADWYALGVMLWQALTGRFPFEGGAGELLTAKRRGPRALTAEPADLARLAVALLDPAPQRRPGVEAVAHAVGATAPVDPGRFPFVGRGRELDILDQAWVASRERVVRVLVRGPSGVGKTALVHRFATSIGRDRGMVAVGRCYERLSVPYKAIHGVATSLAFHLRGDADARTAMLGVPDIGLLASVIPPLAAVDELLQASRTAPILPDPQQLRSRVFDAFRAAIRTLAAHRPLAIVIDDLQWADRDGLQLLEHVATGDGPPFLLVATLRDEPLRDDASWVGGGVELGLGPLIPGDAEQLVCALTDDIGDAAAIAREADGHPLYIAELVRYRRTGGGASLRLEEAIGRRVAALPPEQARLLELVALTGAPLPQRLVCAAAALDGTTFWAALGSLRAAHLVRTHGPGAGEGIEPYHDRVRESVVARLDRGVRRDRHARLAQALARDPAGAANPGLLADHLEAAGDHRRAAVWAERAAERAAAALAFERAAELYQRALDLDSDDAATAARRRVGLGDALANAGRGALAADAYLTAAYAAPRGRALDLRRRAAEQLLRSGSFVRGTEVLGAVLREVRIPDASSRRFPLLALLLERLRLRLRLLRGASTPRHGEEEARRLACCWSAVIGMSMISFGYSFEYQARHLRLALAVGDRRRIALGIAYEAVGAAAGGLPARRAFALLDEATRRSSELDDPLCRAFVAMARGGVAFLCARWRAALSHCDVAEDILRNECIGAAWEIATVQRISLMCLWNLVRLKELRRRVAQALRDAELRHDLYLLTQLRTVHRPNVLLAEDRPDLSRAELAQTAHELEQHGLDVPRWQHTQSSALVALYAGDPVTAVHELENRLPLAQRALLFRVMRIRAFSCFVRGTAYLGGAALGRPEARRWLRLAARDQRTLSRLPDGRAGGDLLGAQIALLRGDRAEARRLYRAAADGFAAAEMGLAGTASRWRLAELEADTGARAAIEAELAAEGVVRPDRLMAMLTPVQP
jgi:tetratricopeptide (TPR) repeat protein